MVRTQRNQLSCMSGTTGPRQSRERVPCSKNDTKKQKVGPEEALDSRTMNRNMGTEVVFQHHLETR